MSRGKKSVLSLPEEYLNTTIDTKHISPLTDEQRILMEQYAKNIFGEQDFSKINKIVPGTDMKLGAYLSKYAHEINVKIIAVLDPFVLRIMDANRELTQEGIIEILKNHQTHGVLPNISFVDHEAGVKDGQHRKIVAHIQQTAGEIFPLFCIFVPTRGTTDVVALNTGKARWLNQDSIRILTHSDDPEIKASYTLMQKLITKYHLSVKFFVRWLSNKLNYKTDDLHKGSIIFTEQHYDKLSKDIEQAHEIMDALSYPRNKNFVSFFNAIMLLSRMKHYTYDLLLKQINQYPKIVKESTAKPLGNVVYAYEALASIYNYENENPVPHKHEGAKKFMWFEKKSAK